MSGQQGRFGIAAFIVLVAGLGDVAGQGRGVPGDIAFFSGRSGNNDVYLMTWDGRQPRQITDDPGSDVDPAWSPNGRQIVFHSNRDGNFEIYVMDADGRQPPTRVTNYPGIDQFPDWSPDGRRIVFRRDLDIYVMELTTGIVTRLTAAPPLNQMAVWSRSGQRLAFMSARDGYPSVFLMNADGSNQRNLTPKNPGDADADWVSRAPSWSANGQYIFFMSFRPSTNLDTEIFVMNADGSGVTRLTNSIGVDGSPRGR